MARQKKAVVGARELGVIEVRGAAGTGSQGHRSRYPQEEPHRLHRTVGQRQVALAFDTIFAEDSVATSSLSAYARQFLGQLEKPHYESIRGLAPTIAIEQKAASRNPRSTVGTITEIYDYLRVLYARVGVQHCYSCCGKVGKRSAARDRRRDPEAAQAEPAAAARAGGLAPQGRVHADLFDKARKRGYIPRARQRRGLSLEDPIKLDKKRKHTIEIVVAVWSSRTASRSRSRRSVETGPARGRRRAADHRRATRPAKRRPGDLLLRAPAACCDTASPELSPPGFSFSFNSPLGMCTTCNGLGTAAELDIDKVIPDPSLSINEGAIAPWGILGDEDRPPGTTYRREACEAARSDSTSPGRS